MTSEVLGEMFEGDSADTCAGKFPQVSIIFIIVNEMVIKPKKGFM
jgi:hypothetical protein